MTIPGARCRGLRFGGILLAGAVLSCARTPHFADSPIVWYVDDDRDIPQPKPRTFAHIQYFSDILGLRRLPRALELRDLEPAHDTNALDEVPNSTWFTNRIGVRRIDPQRAVQGPMVDGPPRLPLTVLEGNTGGRNPGFRARDATGRIFVVKPDRPGHPRMQTGNDVIVDRIMWTIGYNVPQDTLISFTPDDVILDPEAMMQPHVGKERLMTHAELEDLLAAIEPEPDGRLRASASQFLDGVPLGGPPAEGIRRDDPNDVIRHEDLRVLRGLRVFAAWLSHTDFKEDNLIDMYVEDDGRHFVRHYLVDFGETLGGHVAETNRLEDGYEFIVDWEKNGEALLSFGLWRRPWEGRKSTPWPEVGVFSAEDFDPVRWREAYPFWPFFELDPADAYWAAKIVMRFDRPLLAALVAQGQFSAEVSRYLVDTLLARARKIGEAFIETVTPLDAFVVKGGRLCAHDLGIVYGLAHGGVVQSLGRRDRVLDQFPIPDDGRVCLPLAQTGYEVLRLRVRRGTDERPAMQVHVAGLEKGEEPHVVGIIRSERGPCMRGRGRPRCR